MVNVLNSPSYSGGLEASYAVSFRVICSFRYLLHYYASLSPYASYLSWSDILL